MKIRQIQSRYKFPKLFSETKDGHLRSFKINCYQLKSGYAIRVSKKRVEPSGKMTYDYKEFTEGKNIGRSNETSPWEQCLREAQSQYAQLQDKGYFSNIEEKSVSPEPMLAMKWDESKIEFPCMVQPKLDGIRCICYEENGEVHLKSRRGKELEIPQVKEYLEKNRGLLPLDGELYNHDNLSFQGIVSAVKKLSKKTQNINLIVYDKPLEGINNYKRQFKYLLADSKNTSKNAPIKYLSTDIANSLEEIYILHDKYRKEGYEGAIIRNFKGLYEFGYRSKNLIKLKKFYDEEFPIVDIIEATGRDKGTAIFILKAKNGKTFNARPQGSKALRTQYLLDRKKLIGKPCTVKYQELSEYGIPRFPSAIAIRDYE